MNQSLRTGSTNLSRFLTTGMYLVGFYRCPLRQLLCVLALSSSTLAQDSSSILSGRVLDIQGAGIPGAIVKVTNTETGLKREVIL